MIKQIEWRKVTFADHVKGTIRLEEQNRGKDRCKKGRERPRKTA